MNLEQLELELEYTRSLLNSVLEKVKEWRRREMEKVALLSTSQDKDNKVTELLECIVCLDLAVSPIQSCSNGHLTCGLCREQVHRCALCRAPLSLCPFAERIVRKQDFIVACRNVDAGCTHTYKSTQLVDHLAGCVFGPMGSVSPRGPVSTTLIMDISDLRGLGVPYRSKRVELPSRNSEFQVTVKGMLMEDPYEFAIDILEGDNLVFHMNPRWSESRTTFNAFHGSSGWGQEEYRFYESLTAESDFEISIVYCRDRFTVNVNNETGSRFSFRRRFPFESTSKEIRVCKANRAGHDDLELHRVQLDVFCENEDESRQQREPAASEYDTVVVSQSNAISGAGA